MIFIHFQADIATAHDADKISTQQRKISIEEIRHHSFFFFFFLKIQNLKYGFGLSEMCIIYDDAVTFIMHTVLCLMKTFNSRNNRKPLGLESFV